VRKSEKKMNGFLKSWQMRGFLSFLLIFGVILAWNLKAKAEPKPSLAILPFFVERIVNPARGAVLCPLCKGVYRGGQVLPGSQNILTRFLYEKIEALGTFKVLPLEKVEKVLTPSVKEQFEEKPIPSAIQMGKELEADFILVGYLFRFEERIGSRIGAEKPASVGFDVHLLRLRDQKRVWDGKFDETQRPLSENVLKIGSFFRRQASWLSAEELASVGMDEMLKKLPGLKELEEEQ
jgi:hypothetical protein